MSILFRSSIVVLVVGMALLFVPEAASAYVGPGGIVSGVGALLAAVAAIAASVFGFVWFPLKRLVKALRRRRPDEPVEPGARPGFAPE